MAYRTERRGAWKLDGVTSDIIDMAYVFTKGATGSHPSNTRT